MFLHMLDDDQTRALFTLAAQMVTADKVVSGAEVDYLNALAREAGIDGKEALRDKDKKVDLAIFGDRRSQVAVAMELLIIANVDESYDPEELEQWDNILVYFDFTTAEREHLRANAEVAGLLIRNIEDLTGAS